MIEGNLTLDGYQFGGPDSKVVVLEDGFDTGYAANRTQDADMPRGDGVLFGRDHLESPTWSFTLGVRDDEDVYTVLGELADKWRADNVRNRPGAYSTLKFNRGGKSYVVYGRPRRFAVTPAKSADNQFQIVEADFKLLDPYVYSGTQNSLKMGLIETASTGGVVLPQTLPWTLAGGTGERKGIVTVEGFTPTPLIVRIYGPTAPTTLSDPEIKAPGFYLKLSTQIKSGQMVEVNTRTRTVMSDGNSMAAYLTPRSRLGTRLNPGSTEFTFSGTDSSYTSQVEFLWRSAEYSI